MQSLDLYLLNSRKFGAGAVAKQQFLYTDDLLQETVHDIVYNNGEARIEMVARNSR